jgi:hypothetical protein
LNGAKNLTDAPNQTTAGARLVLGLFGTQEFYLNLVAHGFLKDVTILELLLP